jgi:hypothetical protein
MPYIAPNRYWARPDWEQLLVNMSVAPNQPEFDLVVYWQWRKHGHEEVQEAWERLRMRPDVAKRLLKTDAPLPTNTSGLIPPELFSRVLARSRATAIDPNDIADDAIVENPPSP